MSTHHTPRILVVGAIGLDYNHIVPPQVQARLDAKMPDEESVLRLGGGGGNCVQALRKLDEAFETHSYVRLITRIGRPPANNLVAKLAHIGVTELLSESEIDFVDATRGESAIAFNSVAEHSDGRCIFKNNVENPHELAHGIEETIDNEVRGADVVFIDPAKPRIGVMAARSANKHHKPLVVDWGHSEWPKDAEKAEMIDEILRRTDVLMVPDDAVVKGMDNNVIDPDKLISQLKEVYRVPHIIMSNGGKPVQVHLPDESYEIPVEPWDGMKYALAAGDTRNAGFLHALSRGYDVLEAAKIGTAVASVKIRYPGLQWADHIADHIDYNPSPASSIHHLDQTHVQNLKFG